MKAMILDDEPFCIEYLQDQCAQIVGLNVVATHTNPLEALEALRVAPIDLLLLDVEMPVMNGIAFVKAARDLHPDMAVVFVTGYEQYALEAFRTDAVAYLLKPCDCEELQHAIERARRLVGTTTRVKINTFGHFAMFIDGAPVHFANSKAKELLALCVDRAGGEITLEQAIDVLWEDRAFEEASKQLYRKAVIYLNQMMEANGLTCFASRRGSCYIQPAQIDCDAYRLFEGNAESRRHWAGEYMADYSWAEITTARIERFLGNL